MKPFRYFDVVSHDLYFCIISVPCSEESNLFFSIPLKSLSLTKYLTGVSLFGYFSGGVSKLLKELSFESLDAEPVDAREKSTGRSGGCKTFQMVQICLLQPNGNLAGRIGNVCVTGNVEWNDRFY